MTGRKVDTSRQGPPADPWEFPWPPPRSSYDTDGPRETTAVHLVGATYQVEPTGGAGVHTGRDRFRVECLTCPELLHPGTTGPSHRIRAHHNERHRPAR